MVPFVFVTYLYSSSNFITKGSSIIIESTTPAAIGALVFFPLTLRLIHAPKSSTGVIIFLHPRTEEKPIDAG